MKIKNPALAGVELGLRDGTGSVTGDADGVFDLPDKDAEWLLRSPRWSRVKTGTPVAAAAPEPPPEPEPEPEPAEPEPAPEPAPEPEAAPDEGDDDDEAEGPDLDAMTKAELLATAAEYGVDDVDAHMRKDDIKAAVEAAIFEDEGE